jgi:hypothetical protein
VAGVAPYAFTTASSRAAVRRPCAPRRRTAPPSCGISSSQGAAPSGRTITAPARCRRRMATTGTSPAAPAGAAEVGEAPPRTTSSTRSAPRLGPASASCSPISSGVARPRAPGSHRRTRAAPAAAAVVARNSAPPRAAGSAAGGPRSATPRARGGAPARCARAPCRRRAPPGRRWPSRSAAGRAEEALGVLDRLAPLLDGREVPAAAVKTHGPDPRAGGVEGEPPPDGKRRDRGVVAEGREAVIARAVHRTRSPPVRGRWARRATDTPDGAGRRTRVAPTGYPRRSGRAARPRCPVVGRRRPIVGRPASGGRRAPGGPPAGGT